MVERIDSLIGRLEYVALLLASLIIGGVTIWILVSISSRFIPGFQVVGTAEVATVSVVAVAYLCIPYAMRHGAHIRTTVLLDKFPPKVNRAIVAGSSVLGAGVFLFLAWASWGPMMTSWATGEFSGEGALAVPTAPLRTLVVFGSCLMAVECLLATWRQGAPNAQANQSVDIT